MGAFVALLGVVVVTAVVYDAVVTTLAPASGAGPLTNRSGKWWWWLVHRFARDPHSGILNAAGPVALLWALVGWGLG